MGGATTDEGGGASCEVSKGWSYAGVILITGLLDPKRYGLATPPPVGGCMPVPGATGAVEGNEEGGGIGDSLILQEVLKMNLTIQFHCIFK